MEVKEVFLPEFLCVNRAPSKMILLANFFSKLVDRWEGLLVLIEELKDFVKKFVDITVNPVAILEFNDNVQYPNIGHDLMATLACYLEIVKKQQNYSHNLFFIKEIENLNCSFNNVKGIVFEMLESEFVIRHDPESRDNIVGNLVILSAFLFKKVWENFESLALREIFCQFVSLKQVHERESICLLWNLEVTSHLNKPTHKLFGWLFAVFISSRPITQISLIRYN